MCGNAQQSCRGKDRLGLPVRPAPAGGSPDQKFGIAAAACGLADAGEIEDREECYEANRGAI
jgi:hypothetical protein